MYESTGTLIVAVYPGRGLAEEDLEILLEDPLDDDFEVVDVALVFKDDAGRVGVSHAPRRKLRRSRHLQGRRSVVDFRRGLQRRDVREVGEALESSRAAVIAVGSGPGAERLTSLLHCSELLLNQIKHVDMEFRRLLSKHAESSGAYARSRLI